MQFPDPTSEITQILVVSDLGKAKEFYSNVLGAEFFNEYGGTSAVYKFLGNWILIVTGGGPTPDKPDVIFESPKNPDRVASAFTIRVQNCNNVFEELSTRGAKFLTPPAESEYEIRAFFRDPDGHLFEISESKS